MTTDCLTPKTDFLVCRKTERGVILKGEQRLEPVILRRHQTWLSKKHLTATRKSNANLYLHFELSSLLALREVDAAFLEVHQSRKMISERKPWKQDYAQCQSSAAPILTFILASSWAFILQSIDLCNSNSSSIQTKSDETVLFLPLYEKFFSSANTPQTLKLCFFLNVRRKCCNYCKKRLLLLLSRLIRQAERNLKSHTVSCFDFLVHRCPFQKPEISRIIKASRKKLWLNEKQTTLQILLLGSRLFFSSVVTNSNKHVFWRQCVVLS